jgi:protein-tyrosine phosphatase
MGYRKFIDVLLNPQGALLFHCFAGKDRTGWGAVIILKILGVSDEDIVEDYLATNAGRKAANDQLIEEYRAKGFTDEQLIYLEELMSVKASYLEVAFNIVREKFSTFDNYLAQVLNVTDEEVAKLRRLYLV